MAVVDSDWIAYKNDLPLAYRQLFLDPKKEDLCRFAFIAGKQVGRKYQQPQQAEGQFLSLADRVNKIAGRDLEETEELGLIEHELRLLSEIYAPIDKHNKTYVLTALCDLAQDAEHVDSLLSSEILSIVERWRHAATATQPGERVPDARFPDDGNGDDDAHNAGFNECRDLWLASLGQQPAQGGSVDLEQFRKAVIAWKHEGEERYSQDGVFHLKLGPNHYRAMELLDVIAAQPGGSDRG